MAVTRATTATTYATIVTRILELTGCINMFVWWIPRETTCEVAGIHWTLWRRNKCSLRKKQQLVSLIWDM